MGTRAPTLDQLLPHPNRDGQIGQAIPVQMPERAPAQAELEATEAVGRFLSPGQLNNSRRMRSP